MFAILGNQGIATDFANWSKDVLELVQKKKKGNIGLHPIHTGRGS